MKYFAAGIVGVALCVWIVSVWPALPTSPDGAVFAAVFIAIGLYNNFARRSIAQGIAKARLGRRMTQMIGQSGIELLYRTIGMICLAAGVALLLRIWFAWVHGNG
jgi:hypothetical protein